MRRVWVEMLEDASDDTWLGDLANDPEFAATSRTAADIDVEHAFEPSHPSHRCAGRLVGVVTVSWSFASSSRDMDSSPSRAEMISNWSLTSCVSVDVCSDSGLSVSLSGPIVSASAVVVLSRSNDSSLRVIVRRLGRGRFYLRRRLMTELGVVFIEEPFHHTLRAVEFFRQILMLGI